MKMLVHHGNEPGCAGLALCILWFADDDDGWWSECRKRGQEIDCELSRTGIQVIADLREFLWRRGIVRQELRVFGHQDQGRGHLVPIRPDPVLDLRRKTVELANADRIIWGNIRGKLRSRILAERHRSQK